MMSSATPTYRQVIAGASLVLGPLLMSAGDLIHPKEYSKAAAQAAVIVDHASRWYTAHLLLFIGKLVLIPGILALAALVAEHNPAAGYAARVLVLAGVAAFAAIFVTEMLIGRYVLDGADASTAADLLETFQSGWVLGAVMIGGIAFFAGVAAFAIPLVRRDEGLRWPAVLFMLGALLILAEIISSQVLLSQIGNVVLLVANALFATHVLRTGRMDVSGDVVI
jgi:hypothetical protein